MSGMDRRKFLKSTGALLGTATLLSSFPIQCGNKNGANTWSGFKYSMCNESMQELSWADQCQIIGNAGYSGVEIAPFTMVEKGVQEISSAERQEMVQVMQDNGLKCVGLHWLLSPPPEGLHFTTMDTQVRSRTVDYLSRLVDFCGDLGGSVMIFGSPNQRSTVDGQSLESAMENFADGMAQVADQAQNRGVKILVEPLSSDQTDVVNITAEAMKIVRMVDHPAIQTMFDFHNTLDETMSFEQIIREYSDYIHHVHVQKMNGDHLQSFSDVEDYMPAFETLKELNYDKWVSLEVFDFSPGGKTIAQESMQVLEQVNNRLT